MVLSQDYGSTKAGECSTAEPASRRGEGRPRGGNSGCREAVQRTARLGMLVRRSRVLVAGLDVLGPYALLPSRASSRCRWRDVASRGSKDGRWRQSGSSTLAERGARRRRTLGSSRNPRGCGKPGQVLACQSVWGAGSAPATNWKGVRLPSLLRRAGRRLEFGIGRGRLDGQHVG